MQLDSKEFIETKKILHKYEWLKKLVEWSLGKIDHSSFHRISSSKTEPAALLPNLRYLLLLNFNFLGYFRMILKSVS